MQLLLHLRLNCSLNQQNLATLFKCRIIIAGRNVLSHGKLLKGGNNIITCYYTDLLFSRLSDNFVENVLGNIK